MNVLKNHKNLIFSVTISFLWICLISMTTGIYFETNDDRLFSEIFSGAMTGTPEFRSYYIHPFLGLFITFFYRITTTLPWYGLLLILFQWICHASFTHSALSRYEKTHEKLVLLSLLIAYYGICFTFIAHIQFTSTAALLAITGYLCLFLSFGLFDSTDAFLSSNFQKTNTLILFFTLQLLSYLLRSDSMLMIQPYGMAMLASLLLCGIIQIPSVDARKALCLFFCKLLLGVILLIVLGKSTHFLFHHNEGWTEYEKINQGVTEITDYSRIPEYAEVESILKKYEVSEKQYQAFFQYAMIEPNLSGDCLLELAAYSKEMQPQTSFRQILSKMLESYHNPEYYGAGKLALVLWAVAILSVLLSGRFLFLLPLAGLFLSRTAIWGYLIYRGRTPFRVIFPLWCMEILLLGVLLSLSAGSKNCFFILLLLGTLWMMQKQYNTIKPQNVGDQVYNAGYLDLIDYCDDHPENHYFLDAGILLYYRGSAYTTKPFHPRNSLITGCWYSGAPVLYDRIAKYAPNNTDIYLVVSPDLANQKEAVLAYFEEWRDTEAVYEESFTVSNGGIYEVYGFHP